MTERSLAVLLILLAAFGSMASESVNLEEDVNALWEARLYSQAIDRLSRVAADSSEFPVSRRLMGIAYRKGYGVDENAASAAAEFRVAALAGDARAQYELADAYAVGRGVPQSAESAFTWYELSADREPRAALRYAEIVLANSEIERLKPRHEPIGRLRFAADAGLARAQFVLASLMLNGAVEPEEDGEAERLLEQAAASDMSAKTALARLAHGEQNYSRSRALFEDAHAAGDTSASAFLAFYAEMGIGEPIDRAKALRLYELARDVEWTTEGARRLRQHFSSVEMFGLRMYGTSRPEVRAHFASIGLRMLDGRDYFDAYDIRQVLEDRDGFLTVAFAPGQPAYVAEINYQFKAADKRSREALFDQLAEGLVGEYGEADRNERSKGDRLATWKRDDTTIVLRQGVKHDNVMVTYKLYPYAKSLGEYLAQRNDTEKGVYRDAF